MAKALAGGAVRVGLVNPEQLLIAEPNASQRDLFTASLGKVSFCDHGHEVLADCDRVVLAVKPQVLKQIGGELGRKIERRHLLISIAAGISLSQLQELFGTKRIVRVMPNTPSQVGAGAAGIAADGNVSESDVAWVEQLMKAVGTAVRVPDHLLHAVTGVSGSGPAYIYLVIEALSDGGVAQDYRVIWQRNWLLKPFWGLPRWFWTPGSILDNSKTKSPAPEAPPLRPFDILSKLVCAAL